MGSEDIQISEVQQFRAERARTSYIHFVRYVFKYIYRKAWRENWHHQLMAEYLEACQRRELLRLIINMPPRYTKSEMSTMIFDAWCKGVDPKFSFVSASYSADLASDHSRMTRNIIADPAYRVVFPDTSLAKDSKEKMKWETTEGGQRIVAGVGGSLTGKGGDGIGIDDPHKPLMTEFSEASRLRDISWFQNTLYSRLDDKKKGFIILTMQRLHDQDLTGYLLDNGDEDTGMAYEHLIIASTNPTRKVYTYGKFEYVRAAGELIFPAFEGEAEIAATKRIMSNFSSQYDQDPIDLAKQHFKAEGFLPFDYYHPPERLVRYGTADFAVTEGGGDFTVHAVWGVDEGDILYLLECWREQSESDVWVEAILDSQKTHRMETLFAEKGQIEKSVGPFLRKRMRERKIYVDVVPMTPIGSKTSRSQSFRARHNSLSVRYPTNAPWWDVWFKEHQRFPKGKNDDCVDNSSYIGLALDELIQPSVPKAPPKKSWRDRLKKRVKGPSSKSWMRA